MINVLKGNILESKAQTLVNTVNCVGVMGKGIALSFKKSFPEMYKDYVKECNLQKVKLGEPYLFKSLIPPWILNFPTKEHWRSVSRLEDIEKGLKYLLKNYEEWGIKSIAVPPLGCGHGQLDWYVVGPTLYSYLSMLDIPIELYAPYDTPDDELQLDFLSRRTKELSYNYFIPNNTIIKPSWIALVEILNRIEKHMYHWPVGRTVFQKIAFVATNEGLPTGLTFQKGSYGPFSTKIKKELITRLVNNRIIKEERIGKMFSVKVGPTFNDAYKLYTNQINKWENIIEKTSDLFMRIKKDQAEVVATVLFVEQNLSKLEKNQLTELQILNTVMQWKQRRRPPIEERDVAYTIRNLAALGWLKVNPSRDLPIEEEVFW